MWEYWKAKLRGPLRGGSSEEDAARLAAQVEGLLPEQRLFLAVYYKAVYDYRAHLAGKLLPGEEEVGRDAEAWLFCDPPEGKISIQDVADALDVSVERLRAWAREATDREVFSPCAWKTLDAREEN